MPHTIVIDCPATLGLPPHMVGLDNLNALTNAIRHCIVQNGSNCSLNHIDVSKCTRFDNLFSGQFGHFTGDISQWNTENAIHMERMFERSAFNGDISRWNVAKVESMERMFSACAFRGDISGWNVGNVESMEKMFLNTPYQGDLSNWNVSNVGAMGDMFHGSAYNGDLSRWNVGNVYDMQRMFVACHVQDISKWDVKNVRHFSSFMELATCRSDLDAWQIHPEADVESMMVNCDFQGRFPEVPVDNVMSQVLDKSYRGQLADTYDLDKARRLVRNKKWLDEYLKATANQGLSALHMAKAASLKSKPAWMTTKDFKWVKDHYSLALGLGMSVQESARWMATQYMSDAPKGSMEPDSINIDFSSVV